MSSFLQLAPGDGFLSGQNGKAIPATASAVEVSTRGVVAHAPTVTLIRIKAAANMLILRISILLLMAIMITAYAAAALATLTRIGIVRMSGIVAFGIARIVMRPGAA